MTNDKRPTDGRVHLKINRTFSQDGPRTCNVRKVSYISYGSIGECPRMTPDKRLLPIRALRARYDVCTKTIDRWIAAGTLTAPVRIHGRRYWHEEDLEKLERASLAAGPVPSSGP
jgi:hypothetical protein